MPVPIKFFDPENCRPYACFLIIGQRNTGKSTMLRDLLCKTQKTTDIALAITKSRSSQLMFETMIPSFLVHNEGYDAAIMSNFINTLERLALQNRMKRGTLITDDLMVEPEFQKNKEFVKGALNGRQFGYS